MNKTNIEWCDYTWNPVTGCLHDCEYCYARGIAKRFGGSEWEVRGYEGECYDWGSTEATQENHELYESLERVTRNNKSVQAAHPFYFDPTFHRYRLNEPQQVKTPQNIFVVSMGDLFGEWVPDEWIEEVLKSCEAAPQHRYLFLTKNPERYVEFSNGIPTSKNFWYGSTVTTMGDPFAYANENSVCNYFLSIEPIMEKLIFLSDCILQGINWVIIGAETGNRKNKVIPRLEWIENIVNQCRAAGVPVFMKNSLADIWGEPLIQEYPWNCER